MGGSVGRKASIKQTEKKLSKAPTGIRGLDELTFGGLPRGQSTLICGSAGSGKTLFGAEFLTRGATEFGEPGVLITFEESEHEMARNVASLGFDFDELVARKLLVIDFVHIDRNTTYESGEWSLEGLFVRMELAIDSIGAKRVVLDTIESLFAGLRDTSVLRAELHRLFSWLKAKGVTAVITAERGDGTMTRHGLEEYVSDCVIMLDHRIHDQVATRRMRIVKYRGSRHGADEYPFLVGDRGLSVLPITSMGLTHIASNERISTGVARMDSMLGGQGYYRGSSVLVSGTAGTGKTSLAAHLVDAACRRSERCLYFLFEESPSQYMRNMLSIGLDLEPWVKKGLLKFHAARPNLYGLEAHLMTMHQLTEQFAPQVVVMDPVTNLITVGTVNEVKSLLVRLIDFFKMRQITAFFTSLNSGNKIEESTDIGISSLMDTWLMLRDHENNGERNRLMYVLKSRGMAHSNQVREFRLTENGIELIDVYIGQGNVFTGTARLAQEMREKEESQERQLEFARRKHEQLLKGQALRAQIATLQLELGAAEDNRGRLEASEGEWLRTQTEARSEMGRVRQTDANSPSPQQRKKTGVVQKKKG
jgi:circadian clock protein KaiC